MPTSSEYCAKGESCGVAMLPFSGFAEPWNSTAVAFAEWNEKIYSVVISASMEWLDFAIHRLIANLTLAQNLWACRSTEEIGHLYTDFLETALADYERQFSDFIGPHSRSMTAKLFLT